MGQSARIQLCKALRDLSKKTQSCNCCQIANHQNKVKNTFVYVLNFCSLIKHVWLWYYGLLAVIIKMLLFKISSITWYSLHKVHLIRSQLLLSLAALKPELLADSDYLYICWLYYLQLCFACILSHFVYMLNMHDCLYYGTREKSQYHQSHWGFFLWDYKRLLRQLVQKFLRYSEFN